MRRGIVFIFLFCTLTSCKNIPEYLQDNWKDFVVPQESDGVVSNEGRLKQSAGNLCISDSTNECKEKEIKGLLPPQMPKLTGFVNDDERIWLQSPYQVNHYANVGTLGVDVGNYGGVLYPYAHRNLFAALNPTMPVSRLPPVFTTQIRETTPYFVPYLNDLPRTRFTRDDEYQDFLDQLNHDAIMENVLPTMTVPMARSYGSQVPPIASPAIALYPANVARCGIPLLLSCSPNISRGVLGAYKNQAPTVINKYRAEPPKDPKKEDTKAKSIDPEALVMPEHLHQ